MKWIEFLPVFIAFLVTAVCTGLLIPFLNRKKVDQTERKEGVASHLKKAGTPTMGGIAIIAGILVVALLYFRLEPAIVPIMILTFGFGLVGFLDDFLKVVLHRSDGLIAWQKLLLEIVVTAVFLYVMVHVYGVSLSMLVPFNTAASVDFGAFSIPFAFLVILATVNGVNFTDGLDGLASSVTIVVALFFSVSSMMLSGGITRNANGILNAPKSTDAAVLNGTSIDRETP